MKRRRAKSFISFTATTAVFLFIFTFWLGFPGYFQEGDIYNSISIRTDHWHPIIIARFLEFLYNVFGKHSFYLFVLNIFCFYAGIFIYIMALFRLTGHKFWYFLFLLTLIGNIFFQNFVQYHSFSFPMIMWFGCSLITLYMTLVEEKSKLSIVILLFSIMMLLISIMWRHNAIISVYPLILFLVYLLLKRNTYVSRSDYLWRFFSFSIVAGIILIGLVKYHPYLLSDNISKTTANHIFLHQIIAMVAPANDDSIIPNEWYETDRNFDYAREMYYKYQTVADPFNVPWEPYDSQRPFVRKELVGLKMIWLKTILLYPGNYFAHISRYLQEMWFQWPGWILNSEKIQKPPNHPWHRDIASHFKEKERHISFSPLRKKIYDTLYDNKILVNHIVGVSIGFFLLIVCIAILIFFPKFVNDYLIFALFLSVSTTMTSIGVCVFAPYPDARYMSPVLVLALMSLICAVCWIVSFKARRRHHF